MSRWLVTGASGQLGAYLLEALSRRGRDVVAWSGSRTGSRAAYPLVPVDLADPNALSPLFHTAGPTVVLHAAARSAIADCFREPERARRVNADATGQLAGLCAHAGARLVLVSTDLVFDGEAAPYREGDAVGPLSVYAATKVAAEQIALACPGAAVARLSLLFGPSRSGVPTLFDQHRAALDQGAPLALFADEWRTALDLATAAEALVHLADSRETGLFHIGGPERMSRLEMGQRLARHLGRDEAAVQPTSRRDASAAEPRPRDVSLDSTRFCATFPSLSFRRFEEAVAALA